GCWPRHCKRQGILFGAWNPSGGRAAKPHWPCSKKHCTTPLITLLSGSFIPVYLGRPLLLCQWFHSTAMLAGRSTAFPPRFSSATRGSTASLNFYAPFG